MSNTQDYNHMTPGQWLLRLVQGALTGVGADCQIKCDKHEKRLQKEKASQGIF